MTTWTEAVEAAIQRHRAVAVEPFVLGRDLAGAVLKLPRRVGENRAELLAPGAGEEVNTGFGKRGVSRKAHTSALAHLGAAVPG